jgi:hypothetical protein
MSYGAIYFKKCWFQMRLMAWQAPISPYLQLARPRVQHMQLTLHRSRLDAAVVGGGALLRIGTDG